jgi:hypothetical protein
LPQNLNGEGKKMTDLSTTVESKSDQISADDLISGPRTIEITKVSADGGSKEQPILIDYAGSNGKVFKPCKTVRRLLIHLFGPNGQDFVGKKLTLYRDPEVSFGGIKTGGVRISHASHIDKTITVALTATRGSKRPISVKPIEASRQDTKPADTPTGITKKEFADRLRELIDHGTVAAANEYWDANEDVRAQFSEDKIFAMGSALAAKIEKENAQ